jgi:hypothetical protein
MDTKVVLLTGLKADVSEEEVRLWMQTFGTVTHVKCLRDGDPNAPIAMVKMHITQAQGFFIASRLNSRWHQGSLISARVMIR